MIQREQLPRYDVVVIGAKRCGISSLMERFVYNTFSEYAMIGLDVLRKTVENTVSFDVWEKHIPSQNRDYQNRDYTDYARSSALIVAVDLTNREAFEKIKREIASFVELRIPIIIVGTKADLQDQQKVTGEELSELAKAHTLPPPIITSAKNDANVKEAFNAVIGGILTKRIDNAANELIRKLPKQKWKDMFANSAKNLSDKNLKVQAILNVKDKLEAYKRACTNGVDIAKANNELHDALDRAIQQSNKANITLFGRQLTQSKVAVALIEFKSSLLPRDETLAREMQMQQKK